MHVHHVYVVPTGSIRPLEVRAVVSCHVGAGDKGFFTQFSLSYHQVRDSAVAWMI